MLTPREAGLFDDEKLKTSVESGLKSIFPIETEDKILEINKIHFGKNNLDPDNWADIKKAILDKQTVGSPIKGDFVLKDKNTGKALSAKTINLGVAPTMTKLNTFVINGTHYNMPSQFRLRPGGYGRLTRKGEVEVFSNIENAAPIRTQIDLKKKLISLKIGQGKVPIYPILKILGIPDDKMASVMGKEIFVANASTNYENGIKKAYKALFNESYTDIESAEERIREHFLSAKTDPETNKKTLGKDFKNISGDYLLTTVGKVIKITKGEEKPVNRDSLIFKDVYGVEDVLENSLKSYGRSGLPKYKAKNIMRRDDDIAKIINAKAIKKQIEHSFTTSRLSRYAPQANPVAIMNAAFGTTLLGEGGISHLETVPLESKFLQNTHMGFLDPSHTPESKSAGITLTISLDTKKKGRELKTKVINLLTGKTEWMSPRDLDDIPLVFPGEFKKIGNRWKSENKKIHAIHNDKHVTISAYKAKYMISDPQGMFDVSSNLVPFLHSNQGNRGMTSAKMSEQAIALDNAEIPLVETIVDGRPLMDDIGRQFSVRSDVDGEVTKITKEYIIIKDLAGKSVKHYIFDNLPLNDQALLDAEVRVVVGDKIKKDQLLADSTFTRNGKYVYGVNLNTAYLPWRGKNFEDGIVITEDAAKKLSSSHIHRVTLPLSENVLTDIKKYKAYTPYGISKDDIGRYDDDGTLKKGETVKPDDILIASLKQNVLTGADTIISKLKKSAIKPYKDNALRWNKTYDGIITDKVRHKGGIDIYVKTTEPFKVGDKIVARHGNKGVVSSIIKSEMAPITESGEKVDIIFDSHSVVPRINPGQIIENAAGKLAQRTGKTFLVDNFSGLDYRKIIQDEMKKLGIPEKEDIYDPETGKTLPKIAIGKSYVTKLKHQVDTKLSARGLSEPYTQNDQPTSGGGIGGQAVDRLTMNAMLAYNPRELMREMFSIKNNRNNAYWRAIQHGEIPPAPGPSFEYNKFEALLKSMGINVKDKGTSIKLSPLTDKDVLNLSAGGIPSPMKTFVGKGINLTPDKDGLFGEDAGGFQGNRFNHIELDTKIPSPAYKDAIKSILHLKDKDFEELLKK